MTADEFRELALEIPGVVEQSHMNHPDFRLHGRIFASLGAPDEDWGMVKLTPDQQGMFIRKAPKMFKPASGAAARGGARACRSIRSRNRSGKPDADNVEAEKTWPVLGTCNWLLPQLHKTAYKIGLHARQRRAGTSISLVQ